MTNELDEAREKIVAEVANADYTLSRKTCLEVAEQILNLKGKGWSIEVVRTKGELPWDKSYRQLRDAPKNSYEKGYYKGEQDMLRVNYRQVIKGEGE